MLDRLTHDQMKDLVGTTFTVTAGDRAVDLVLDKALKVMESEAARLQRTPFSLHFSGPADPYLPQRTYPVTHQSLGSMEMFLVPIGRTATGLLYEAVFT